MNLKNKVPPPIVASIFAALIYLSADFVPNLVFQGQALLSFIVAISGLIVLLLAVKAFINLKQRLIL